MNQGSFQVMKEVTNDYIYRSDGSYRLVHDLRSMPVLLTKFPMKQDSPSEAEREAYRKLMRLFDPMTSLLWVKELRNQSSKEPRKQPTKEGNK